MARGRTEGLSLAPPALAVAARPSRPTDPPLRAIHGRALDYSRLRPEQFRRLRSGLLRGAWWPDLHFDAGVAYDHDISQDDDQSFTYGALHDLSDRGLEGSLTLTWDFANIFYPTDAPELSREARQVVSLRDNLLDEINQLYFVQANGYVSIR